MLLTSNNKMKHLTLKMVKILMSRGGSRFHPTCGKLLTPFDVLCEVNNEITRQLCLVRQFIIVVYREQHLCLCTNTCPSVNQGQTSETYITVYVDKNTLHVSSNRILEYICSTHYGRIAHSAIALTTCQP